MLKAFGRFKFRNELSDLQQDGAPAHTANVSQAWFRSELPDFISKDEWPPSSPDLNPMDFCVWSVLEANSCVKSHRTVESLKFTLQKEWKKIHQASREHP